MIDGIGTLDQEQAAKVKNWDLATGKTATVITTENTKTLQLAAFGDRLVLLGDEIAHLAAVIRANDADVVQEIPDPMLKPCPFCGGAPRLAVLAWRQPDKREPAACRVQCSVCGARTPDLEDKTTGGVAARGDQSAKRLAKERWNMRG